MTYDVLFVCRHPDKCSADGTEEAFKAVSAAFKGLETTESRRMYDMTGSADSSSVGGTPFSTDDASELYARMFEEILRQHQSGRHQQGGFQGFGPGFGQQFGGAGMPFAFHMGGAGGPGGGVNINNIELPEPFNRILGIFQVLPWQITFLLVVFVGFKLISFIYGLIARKMYFMIAISVFAPSKYKVRLFFAVIAWSLVETYLGVNIELF